MQQDPDAEVSLEAPYSKIAKLLELSIKHNDGFQMQENDKTYMLGWQHALIAVLGK